MILGSAARQSPTATKVIGGGAFANCFGTRTFPESSTSTALACAGGVGCTDCGVDGGGVTAGGGVVVGAGVGSDRGGGSSLHPGAAAIVMANAMLRRIPIKDRYTR